MLNHHCARVGASASTAPRLPTRAHASGWIARAAGALLCLHTTDGTTVPARGVEAGGAIIASPGPSVGVMAPARIPPGSPGHPADQIPPSLGAPAVRSHCVRMDGGMGGGIKVKTQTKPRPWAKFPAASKFFLEPGWWRRGTRSRYHQRSDVSRVIPAWAGNTGPRHRREKPPAGHPRVGGEHMGPPPGMDPQLGSSPRGRGTRQLLHGVNVAGRVIPAWAGNTATRRLAPPWSTDHPRVGGEHHTTMIKDAIYDGSSPRGRGTQQRVAPGPAPQRVIPAWAGNT